MSILVNFATHIDPDLPRLPRHRADIPPIVIYPSIVIPKARPRVTADCTYMPKSYVNCRNKIAMLFADQVNRRSRVWEKDRSYAIFARFYVEKSTSGDTDGLIGTIMDAGKGIVWVDDRQVVLSQEYKIIRVPSNKFAAWIRVFSLELTGFEPKTTSQRCVPSTRRVTMSADEYQKLDHKTKRRAR